MPDKQSLNDIKNHKTNWAHDLTGVWSFGGMSSLIWELIRNTVNQIVSTSNMNMNGKKSSKLALQNSHIDYQNIVAIEWLNVEMHDICHELSERI